MDNAQANRIQSLEQSLINFLNDKKEVEARMGPKYKIIRTIQIDFNKEDKKNPTFIVKLGILSAEFGVKTGLKEKGSCYGIERFIRDWAERESIRNEMLDIINTSSGGGNGANILPVVRNTIR